MTPGTTRTVTIDGTAAEARAERRRLMAAGRPAVVEEVEAGTLGEFAALFFRTRAPTLAPSTVKAYEEAYRLRVWPSLGALELHEVSRERVEVWLADLSKTSSPHATRKAVAALRAILKTAAKWGRIPDNPAAGLDLPKPKASEAAGDEQEAAARRVLSGAQLRMLYAATDRVRVETMLRAGGEAGMRLGEVIGLRWSDVDLSRRRLNVRRSVWQESGRDGAPPTRIVKSPKSGKAREVVISAEFAARLADWYAVAVVEGGADALGYVWPGRDGGAMDDSTPGQALGRICRRAGLVDRDARPLVTFHGLRHPCASILLGAGVPLIVVSRHLGHANPNITATVYAHLFGDEQLHDAVATFDSSTPKTVSARRRDAAC